MSLEDRLYVVMREAVDGQFTSYLELAAKVHDSGAAEFSYNWLDEKRVMVAQSIVPYVSLVHFLDILRVNADEMYECILTEEPTVDGAHELLTRRAIEKLQKAGFSTARYRNVVKEMLRQRNLVLPGPREIYQALTLKMTELHFLQLSTLQGVRGHFGFTLVTRRVMVPTRAPRRAQS